MKDTIELLKETKVGLYYRVNYNIESKEIRLYDWVTYYSNKSKDDIILIREINKEDKDRAKKMKNNILPCISVTGHFPNIRATHLADRLNAVICLDIDKNDNPEIDDWEKMKDRIMKEFDSAFYTSLSCRGQGIFVYIYWDTNKDFKKVWYSLEKEFKEKFGIIIDKNCKDITRLRFISYDTRTLIKKKVIPYDTEYDKEKEYENIGFSGPLNADDEFVFRCISHLIKYCHYRSNTYDSWLQDGFRLATFGEYGKVLFMYLSQCSENYDQSIALKKFEECRRSSRKNKSCLTYYLARLKEYYGPKWRDEVMNKKDE